MLGDAVIVIANSCSLLLLANVLGFKLIELYRPGLLGAGQARRPEPEVRPMSRRRRLRTSEPSR
jgi:hypothetical protein